MSRLKDQIDATNGINLAFSKQSLRYYLDAVVINSHPDPKRFGECAEQWQRDLLGPKIPAFEYLAGLNPGYHGPLSFMTVLPRGHDKSSLEGRLASWLLVASRRPIHGYILAADRDQGRLILQAIDDEARHNDWVRDQIVSTKNVISGPGGFIEVLPCDAASAYGLRGNLYIADEITHWKRQKEWNAMVSGREKIPGSLLVVLSNAGLQDSWQHNALIEARHNPDWVVFERKGQLASWMDRARVDALRRMLPPSEAARLYDNEWIDPAEQHDYLRRSEVDLCADLGRDLGLLYRLRPQLGVNNYVAAIDYGPRRDRTALVLLHQTPDKLIVIDRLEVWQGSSGKPVLVRDVEDWIREVQAKFRPAMFVLDPYQMEGTIQWMQREGIPVEPFNCRGGAGNYELAQHLRAIVVERRIAWYESAGQLGTESLSDELSSLRVKKMPYGYRMDHENQKHDDRAVAIGMASLRARSFPADATNLVMPGTRERQRFLHPGD